MAGQLLRGCAIMQQASNCKRRRNGETLAIPSSVCNFRTQEETSDRSRSSQSHPPRSAGLEPARTGLQQQRDCRPAQHQPSHRQTTSAHVVPACRDTGGPQARQAGNRTLQSGGSVMTPSECLTAKEIEIAILVWEGMTNREIGKIVGTTEQVIKNHLRSIFDKLGVWSR